MTTRQNKLTLFIVEVNILLVLFLSLKVIGEKIFRGKISQFTVYQPPKSVPESVSVYLGRCVWDKAGHHFPCLWRCVLMSDVQWITIFVSRWQLLSTWMRHVGLLSWSRKKTLSRGRRWGHILPTASVPSAECSAPTLLLWPVCLGAKFCLCGKVTGSMKVLVTGFLEAWKPYKNKINFCFVIKVYSHSFAIVVPLT